MSTPPTTSPSPNAPADPGPEGQTHPCTLERARAAGELAVEYLGVADALARRFHCPGHDPEDLRQVARLGLMKAAHRYRAEIGHGFVPYAVPTVEGEIKRYLRDQSWAVRPPRGLQELRLKVNAARPRLSQELGHEPSTRELSSELGISARDVAEAQIADASMVPETIESESADLPEEHPGRRTGVVLGSPDPGFEHTEALHDLARALQSASGKDLELLRLRFVEELTQDQIAQRYGVSQMQVSRLLSSLLARLRRRMAVAA